MLPMPRIITEPRSVCPPARTAVCELEPELEFSSAWLACECWVECVTAGLVVDANEGAAVAVLFGGVEGEGQGPKTIGMAVAVALGCEEDVAAFAGLFAHTPEVGPNQGVG